MKQQLRTKRIHKFEGINKLIRSIANKTKLKFSKIQS